MSAPPPVPLPRTRHGPSTNAPHSPGLNNSAAAPPLPTRPRPSKASRLPSIIEPGPPTPTTPAPASFTSSTPPSLSALPYMTSIPAPIAPSGEGFGTCLQDSSSYDVINKRHDDELLALESLRAHLFNRARIDREYADKLANANLKSTRKVANINKSSAIVKAWLCFLDMSDSIQKQVSSGAAQMSSVLLNLVDQLIKDKRGAKSVFDQERARIENEYKTSCRLVQNNRLHYPKCAQSADNYKKKLTAVLEKEPPKPTEQDKYRRKFVANSEKLYSCHNEYCLALLNATQHQTHYRNSLLPFCLDTLQQRMELNVAQWKEVLTNYAKAVDLTATYEESFRKLYESLEQVDKEEEYVEFIRDNKKEQPPPEPHQFDTNLLTAPAAADLEAGTIVLNNLTHAAMKTRLSTMESELEQNAKDLELKKGELEGLLQAPDESGSFSPTPKSPHKDSGQEVPRHIQIAKIQAQCRELQCQQARKQDMSRLIKETVDAMDDETPPLFDPLGEGVDVKDIDGMATMAPGSATATGKGIKARQSFSVQIATIQRGAKGLFKKMRNRKHTSSDGGGLKESELSMSESQDDFHPERDEDNDSDASSDYDVPTERPVEEEDWYFGDIDRKLSESKCKKEGDYLIRYSERQNKYVLTCHWNGQGKHFVIQHITGEDGSSQYRFESKSFGTINLLLDYHVSTQTPVTRASGAKISAPITKTDKWSLDHSNVKQGKKIGKGAFGDVYEALLTSNQQKVAIKTCRSSDLQDMDKFLQEAEILKQYDHPNVVRLIGVCAEKDPVYIVMEFMPGGAFLDYLRKKGSSQTKNKICQMVVDACRGMDYLESMHCIHRDLASRNCLVGDNDIVKISDFGMSREEEGGVYTVSSGTRQIPIKWTAPEALNYGKYTSASDVWSFGILLWEAYSCGSAPYPGMNNHDARSQIEVGYRMPPPADCPQEVYGVMQQCWQYDPEERPDFATILNMLTQAETRIKD